MNANLQDWFHRKSDKLIAIVDPNATFKIKFGFLMSFGLYPWFLIFIYLLWQTDKTSLDHVIIVLSISDSSAQKSTF